MCTCLNGFISTCFTQGPSAPSWKPVDPVDPAGSVPFAAAGYLHCHHPTAAATVTTATAVTTTTTSTTAAAAATEAVTTAETATGPPQGR